MAAIASATIVARSTPAASGTSINRCASTVSGERLHVVGQRVVAPLHERARLGRAQQHEAGARRRPELDAPVRARVAQQRDDVVAQRARRVHAVRRLDRLDHLGAVGDRLEVEHAVARLVAGQHPGLLLGVRIAERDADHEAVDLRLRQRVGALVLDRVLGREHHERPRQLVRDGIDRHLALLHALEQPGLGLRRGAVDLVDDHDVGEDRAGPELEPRFALVVDVGADDVGRQQVGRALHARELAVDRPRQRAGERGLADARVVLHQDVTLGEERDDHVLEHVIRDLHRPPDVVGDPAGDRDCGIHLLGSDGPLSLWRGLEGFHSARHLHVGR